MDVVFCYAGRLCCFAWLFFLAAMAGQTTVQGPQTSGGQNAIARDGSSRIGIVGFPSKIENFVIAGPLLKPKPIESREQPIILRILETYPHGSEFRYDFEYIGLDPGKFNLADFLERADGEETGALAPIEVEIKTSLPPGQVEPHELVSVNTRFSSFYLTTLLVGGAIWLIGLCLILFAGRHKKGRPSAPEKYETVADRLKPLIDQALRGELDNSEKAELERVLVAFWQKKLRLAQLPADELRAQLRAHPQASILLNQIDNWLHRPDPEKNVDVANLLEPYRAMKYEDI